MSGLLKELKTDFAKNDKEYRHAYVDESLNTSIATQIKVLREQRRLTQQELAGVAEMQQSMISRYENVNYSSWSISTLKKLADAFDVWLDVRFRSFGEFVATVDGFSRESLQVPKFEDDPFFKGVPATPAENVTPASGISVSSNAAVQSTVNAAAQTVTIASGTWASSNAAVQATSLVSTAAQSTSDVHGGNEYWWSRAAGLDPANNLFGKIAQNQTGISPFALLSQDKAA
jgi:transcriptional regulator with XRE-family HTH domain